MLKEISINNARIVYNVHGTGLPVLLVHGFGEDADVWNNQVTFLKDTYQLIVPDLPGSGDSAMITDMSIEGMADVLKKICDAESIIADHSLVVIGHSMGGYITLAFVEKYVSLIKSFGLFHSTAYADNEEKIAARRKGIEAIKEKGAFTFLKTATLNLFSSATKENDPTLVNKQIQSLSYFTPEALIAYYEAMIQRPDRTQVLKDATVPVLFIIGEEDTAIPMNDMLQQSHLPQTAVVHVMKNVGHLGMLEKPVDSNSYINDFLASL